MNPLIPKNKILEYIPQRVPMVMIDCLYEIDEKGAKTGFEIKKDNILLKEDRFSEMGMIENIAQTAAIAAGYYFKFKNEPVKLGFIGAVKNLEIFKLPQIGDEIITEIKEIHEVLDVKIIQGNIFLNEKKIASCEMKIFILNN